MFDTSARFAFWLHGFGGIPRCACRDSPVEYETPGRNPERDSPIAAWKLSRPSRDLFRIASRVLEAALSKWLFTSFAHWKDSEAPGEKFCALRWYRRFHGYNHGSSIRALLEPHEFERIKWSMA